MKVIVIPVTPFQQNCSLIWDPDNQQGAVVDPGGDIEKIIQQIEQHNIVVSQILLTHGHLDHVGGTTALARQLDVPVIGPHQADDFWLQGLDKQSKMFGFGDIRPFRPNQWLNDGDNVKVGTLELNVLHCPGHTPGHVVFFEPVSQQAIVGDVLFNGSIGRSDFPQGNHQQLVNSIREKLFPLGDDVTFYPGHGPTSTFGQERRTNPFVADDKYG
ncbi:MBL fold metallo-hydrolase [Neptunicella sp.]|uniref:MBL fold metallo-hydrolase n=1 Tax=Neptunicella sp. TaxID=2125986 RepID=UPI003F690FCD